MSLRILFDHQVFSWQQYGGISRYYYELITRLAAVPGVDISLFLGLFINRYGLELHRESFASFWGQQRPAIPMTNKIFSGINRLFFPSFLSRSCPDVYHATYYASPAVRFKGARIITVHDMIHERFRTLYPWHDQTIRVKKKATGQADGIICISEATKRDAMELLGIPEDRIAVIYLGSSLEATVSEPPLITQPYLLYVGQRYGYKNFDVLATAVARSEQIRRNFRLVCFGGGPFTKKEKERTDAMGIGTALQYISGDDAVLANLYRHASVYVCTSVYEGFGLPTLEAMHMGCPVLVGNAGSLPEVAGPAGCYFDPSESEDLKLNLEKILQDAEMQNRMRALGLERAKLFSWERCARETLDFYRSRSSHEHH